MNLAKSSPSNEQKVNKTRSIFRIFRGHGLFRQTCYNAGNPVRGRAHNVNPIRRRSTGRYPMQMKKVILVFKTHFDIGFTQL